MFLNFFLNSLIFSTPFSIENSVKYFSIIGDNGLKKIETLKDTDLYDPSRAVARMESQAGYCTGFRIGESLMMTNYHCEQFKSCQDVQFQFGVETELAMDERAKYQCEKVEMSYLMLDFAIYRVRHLSGPEDYPVLSLFNGNLQPKAIHFFPSHAGTFHKLVDTTDECQLLQTDPFSYNNRMVISHTCDSMTGSSGGPLIDKKHHYVSALHWGNNQKQGYNAAIRMKDILEYIEKMKPELLDELTIVRD